MTVPFLDELRAWHMGYLSAGGRRDVQVEWHEGPPDRPKRAAWIVVRAPSAKGQLTLWESGECDTEAVGTPTEGEPHVILLRTRVLVDRTVVVHVADDLVDHVADYSGS